MKLQELQSNFCMADCVYHLQTCYTPRKIMMSKIILLQSPVILRPCLEQTGLISAAEGKGMCSCPVIQNLCSTKSVSGRSGDQPLGHTFLFFFFAVLLGHLFHIHKLSILAGTLLQLHINGENLHSYFHSRKVSFQAMYIQMVYTDFKHFS